MQRRGWKVKSPVALAERSKAEAAELVVGAELNAEGGRVAAVTEDDVLNPSDG